VSRSVDKVDKVSAVMIVVNDGYCLGFYCSSSRPSVNRGIVR
jgi:hypothetical protein